MTVKHHFRDLKSFSMKLAIINLDNSSCFVFEWFILFYWSYESVLFEAGFLLLSIIPRGIGLFWYPPIVSRIGLKLRDIFTILGTLNNSSDWLIESLDSKINIKIIIKPLELLINDKCKFFNFYKWVCFVNFMLDLMVGFFKD